MARFRTQQHPRSGSSTRRLQPPRLHPPLNAWGLPDPMRPRRTS